MCTIAEIKHAQFQLQRSLFVNGVKVENFTGGPVAKILCSQFRGPGFHL